VVDNFPFDKYELEPSPLTQFLLQNRGAAQTCWQTFVSGRYEKGKKKENKNGGGGEGISKKETKSTRKERKEKKRKERKEKKRKEKERKGKEEGRGERGEGERIRIK